MQGHFSTLLKMVSWSLGAKSYLGLKKKCMKLIKENYLEEEPNLIFDRMQSYPICDY